MRKTFGGVAEDEDSVCESVQSVRKGEDRKISGMRLKSQRGVDEMVDEDLGETQLMELPFEWPSLEIQKIFAQVVDSRERLLKMVELYNPTMIDWWNYDDPKIIVWGQLCTDVYLISDDEMARNVFILFGEIGRREFSLLNRHMKQEYVRKHFPDVDFNSLLLKKNLGKEEISK